MERAPAFSGFCGMTTACLHLGKQGVCRGCGVGYARETREQRVLSSLVRPVLGGGKGGGERLGTKARNRLLCMA